MPSKHHFNPVRCTSRNKKKETIHAKNNNRFDFDLCRKILLRLEELVAIPDANKPTRYVFEGYRPSDVDHYIKKMGDDDMVHVRLRPEYAHDHLQRWPIAFRKKGIVFLDYAKDEDVWNAAMEEMRGRNYTPTLKKMKKALREAAEKKAK